MLTRGSTREATKNESKNSVAEINANLGELNDQEESKDGYVSADEYNEDTMTEEDKNDRDALKVLTEQLFNDRRNMDNASSRQRAPLPQANEDNAHSRQCVPKKKRTKNTSGDKS